MIPPIITNVTVVFCTLAIWTILYKENPIYRIAEHAMVGAAAGYYFVTNLNYIIKNGFGAITAGKPHYIIGIILGVLLFTNLSREWSWLSRYGLAIIVGTGMGLRISTIVATNILKQVSGSINLTKNITTPFSMFNVALGIAITIGVIYYFVYSNTLRSGQLGLLQTFGRLGLMMAFGVAYGQTTGYRLNLVIGRMDQILAPELISTTVVMLVLIAIVLGAWTFMAKKD